MRSDRLAENLKNKAITYCGRVSNRLAENLKNNAIALQKTSKIKRSPVVEESVRSHYRKPQKLGIEAWWLVVRHRLLYKSKCVSEAHRRYCLAENLKAKRSPVVEE
ncbi:hypothetical protein COO91_04090 [Nostoc flagelliforme CCNUN1]|uniref:Uncharacterized protein n=1 Tax=Nostoc flagelliforme CCNUN1 TaxID=2038116 RepID=A0A2K8SRS2_9NOSO|nr:hypothetical protein [Nostoc flagelliforme]AUB38127.1 hypothetical protein COO91_04090 [Nostoc flagelliforme CCNUN1]